MIEQINNVFDAIGLGVFAVSGARIGMERVLPTHVSDHVPRHDHGHRRGMIRDVLLREMPFVLKKRVYAVAAILGALGYALLLRVGLGKSRPMGWAC